MQDAKGLAPTKHEDNCLFLVFLFLCQINLASLELEIVDQEGGKLSFKGVMYNNAIEI